MLYACTISAVFFHSLTLSLLIVLLFPCFTLLSPTSLSSYLLLLSSPYFPHPTSLPLPPSPSLLPITSVYFPLLTRTPYLIFYIPSPCLPLTLLPIGTQLPLAAIMLVPVHVSNLILDNHSLPVTVAGTVRRSCSTCSVSYLVSGIWSYTS